MKFEPLKASGFCTQMPKAALECRTKHTHSDIQMSINCTVLFPTASSVKGNVTFWKEVSFDSCFCRLCFGGPPLVFKVELSPRRARLKVFDFFPANLLDQNTLRDLLLRKR